MRSDHIAPLLGQYHHLTRRLMSRQMQEYDFTPVQAQAMMFLIKNRHQEETTQQELERFLKIRPSTANGVVTRLAEKGFLTSAPGKADRRSRQLLLTEKGMGLHAVFEEGLQRHEASMLRGFAPEEQVALRGYLLRIIHNLEEEKNLC